ncbi:Uncharacterised protein [uncultured archaeon]|nr:Uncharacterised protein [uncultured archaeon]
MQKLMQKQQNNGIQKELEELAEGNIGLLDTVAEYIKIGKVKPDELLYYLVDCLTKVSNSPGKYLSAEITEARSALDAIDHLKNPYIKGRMIRVF